MPARSRRARAAAVLALPLLGCKPAPSSTSLEDPAPPVPAPAATNASTPTEPPPAAVVYGHVRIPSFTALLEQGGQTLLPHPQREFLTVDVLRQLVGSSLGPRSALAQHVDLGRPMGCVVTSPLRHALPFACVVGYQGGFSALVDDLGPSGYISGGDDYAAYHIDGQPLFLAAMGQHIAFAFAPDLIAATRDRLQRDIVDAPVGEEELVATAYPSVIFEDARDRIDAFVEQMSRAQADPGNPFTDAMKDTQRRQLLSWGELEQLDVWLDVSPIRARLGYRGTARPGTATENGYAATHHHPPAAELLSQLPAEAIGVMGIQVDMAAMIDDPMLGSYVQAVSSLQGSDVAVAMADQYRQNMVLWRELFGSHAAVALLHERGTKGGVVIVYRLQPGVDALPRLREMLSPSSSALPFRFEHRPGAFRAGKLRGDVWTMKPTETMPPATREGLVQLLGDPPHFQAAYVQRGEVLYMAMAPQKVDRYLRRALAAADGKSALGERESARSFIESHAGDTLVVSAGMAATLRWLDQIDAIPPPAIVIPERPDDVLLTLRPAGERQREMVIDVSAAMIQALFELGG